MGIFKRIATLIPVLVIYITGFSQPAILSHPSDTSVCSGAIVIFSITASNAASYQWQEHDGTGWFDIDETITYAEGENTPDLTLYDVITGLNNYQYRCYIEDDNGEGTVSNNATLNVYSAPIIVESPQDKEVCKNQTATFTIQSENGTSYQWQENRGDGWYNLADNAFYSGSTTDNLDVFTIFGINDYLYRCKVSNNTCSEISEEAMLQVNPLPQVFYVYGGGELCENTNGENIYLNNSELNINYELIHDGTTTVAVREGTGQELDFGSHNLQGTYTVRAVNASTACQNIMNGQATINVLPAPASYNLISTGTFCEGSSGTTLFLENSQTGISYSLILDSNPAGYQINGTGGSLSFKNIHTEGSYSVLATDQTSGCEAFMNNTVELQAAPAPAVFTLAGDNLYCEGAAGASLQLSGSQQEVEYTLLRNGQNTEITAEGDGEPLTFGNITAGGTYTVRASYQQTGCESMMNGEVVMEVAEAPFTFNVSGPAYLCEEQSGTIQLSGSQPNIVYDLLQEGAPTGNMLFGTGQPLDFTIEQEGSYQILATNTSNGCAMVMEGQVLVQAAIAPVADAGSNKEIAAGGSAILEGSASAGSGQYFFNWQPAAKVQDPQVPQPLTVPLESPQLFTLEVTDQVSGCVSEKDSTAVTIENGAFTVQGYAASDSLCSGESTQLYALVQGGSGSYNFHWYTEDGTFSSPLNNPVITLQETTTFIIRVNDGNNLVEDTLAVYVTASPQIVTLNGESSFCQGSEGALLTLSEYQPGVDYQLYRNGTPYNLFPDSASFSVYQGGTYTMMAEQGSCSALMNGTVEVEAHDAPGANAGNDITIYSGQTTQLQGSATGGESLLYQWEPAGQLESATVPQPHTQPLFATTNFELTVTDAATGCIGSSDDVTVSTGGEVFSLNLTAGNESVCPGEPSIIQALPSGGSENYSYQWTSNPQGFFSQDSAIEVFPAQPAWYIANVSDGTTTLSDSVFVDLSPSPDIQTVTGGDGMCSNSPGKEITLEDTQEGVYYTLYHENGALINAVSGNGAARSFGLVSTEGNYYAEATHVASSCTAAMNGNPFVFHYETPQAYAGEDMTIQNNGTASLNGFGTGGSGQYSYFWSPASLVENASAPSTNTVNLSSSTLFRLEVTDQVTGCTSKPDSLLVSVSGSNLSLFLQSNTTNICDGDAVHLFGLASGGTGNYSYTWSSNPPGAEGDSYTHSGTPHNNTTYTLSVSDGESTIEKSIQITINDTPVPDAGGGQQLQYGEEAILLGDASGGSGNNSFQWSPEGLLQGDGNTMNTQSVPLFQDTYFSLQVTDNATGCRQDPDTAHITVEGSGLRVQAIASSQTVCSGKEVSFASLVSKASGTVNYSWTSYPENITSSSPSFTATFTENTTVFLEVSDEKGTASDSLIISVTPSPELFVLTGDAIYCEGGQGSTLLLNDSEQGIAYQLIRNNIFTGTEKQGGGTVLSFEEIIAEGVYTVIAVDRESNCSRWMSGAKTVSEEPNPHRFQVQGGGDFCEQERINIGLTGSEPGVNYVLLHDNQLLDTIAGTGNNLLFQDFAYEGNYTVEGYNTITGCSAVMQNQAVITTYPLPDLTVSNDTTIYEGGSALLSASGADTYSWNTAPASAQSTIEVSPEYTTEYEVTGINQYGCRDTAKVTVTVDASLLPESNAFTPNGDGVNDIFRKGYYIIVFNRWGKTLYEGDEGWDGTYNGKTVPAGTYYFVRKTDVSGNEITPVKGAVTVIRKQN
jgi:gliding motility-associated-like protein